MTYLIVYASVAVFLFALGGAIRWAAGDRSIAYLWLALACLAWPLLLINGVL